MEHKAEADVRWDEAKRAVRERASLNAQRILVDLAQVAAIREQTAVLERIAAALGRRDVVAIYYETDPEEIDRYLRLGWVYLGQRPLTEVDEPHAVLGWPRNAPQDVEGGGEGG